MNIGTNIYTLRKEKKITQAQLAEKLGVSEQAVSKWENDQCAPDVSLFPIIAEFFGVSIDRLFGYHTSSYNDDVEAIMKAADDSMDTYKEIEIIGEGLKKYPNSPDLKIYLAFSLSMVNRMSKDEKEKHDAIEKAITEELEISDGETTSDGLFSLKTVACLGCCSLSPVMMINEDAYGSLTPRKTKEILRKIKSESQI